MTQNLNLIPEPVSVEVGEGFFTLTDSTSLFSPEAGQKAALFGAKLLGVEQTNEQPDGSHISLEVSDEIAEAEGYCLVVSADGISIKAADEMGLFHNCLPETHPRQNRPL